MIVACVLQSRHAWLDRAHPDSLGLCQLDSSLLGPFKAELLAALMLVLQRSIKKGKTDKENKDNYLYG